MNREQNTSRNPTTAALLVAAVVVVVVAVSALAGVLNKPPPMMKASSDRIPGASKITVPRPVQPAFVPANPAPLSKKSPGFRWAPVRKAAPARVKPRLSAPIITNLPTRTPEGTENIVSVLGNRQTSNGSLWVHVSLPVLPNGTSGWVPRRDLGGYDLVPTRLIVDLENYELTLYRGRRSIFKADIGAGKPSSPTPRGNFYIRDKVTDFNNPFYGPVAFGTSARSSTLTDWPAGGFIGIHGTNEPNLIPGAISHGCIRLTDRDIRELARLMPVGTPVMIR
jgi:hypothetical protein